MLLNSLCHSHALVNESALTSVDSILDMLHNCPVLLMAHERLLLQSQDKLLDIIFQAHIFAIVGMLNLFLDLDL